MRPDLNAIAVTLILPLTIVLILMWRIAVLRLANRRKRLSQGATLTAPNLKPKITRL